MRQPRFGEAAAPLRAEHAEAVRVVHHQPRVMRFGQRQQFGQRGDIALHAEYAVGENHLARRLAGRQRAAQRGGVGVRIAVMAGSREQRAVDQRGVVEAVRKDRVAAPGQRRGDAHVDHVAGGKI